MSFPRCLIISHNVIGKDGNMGKTLRAYFGHWPTDKLAQLYFHSEVPTTGLCQRYFRVTDVDLLKALWQFKKPGTVLEAGDIQYGAGTTRVDEGHIAEWYQKGRQRKPWIYFARNTLWSLGHWKSKYLDEWIREFAPEVIFYASGDYTFSFRIAQYISTKYGVPLVTSIVDDYYFHRKDNKGLLAKWNTRRFRAVMEQTMGMSARVLYVHPAMQRKYEEKFSLPGDVLYTNAPIYDVPVNREGPVCISYMGGLSLNRYQALKEIGQTLLKLVPDGSVQLDVYSGERDPEILSYMTAENGICFKGQISFEQVQQTIQNSDIVVMAESRDPEILERIRYSLSTKVAECLGSGRCLLAYGPAEAGSISYLLEYGAGCVATTPQELEARLKEILYAPEVRNTYANGEKALAMKHHTQQRNHEILLHALRMAVMKNGK